MRWRPGGRGEGEKIPVNVMSKYWGGKRVVKEVLVLRWEIKVKEGALADIMVGRGERGG